MAELIHIVDDDEIIRASLSYLLFRNGYSPLVYEGGVELLSDRELTSGCIVLDLHMPQMSGHEVLEELARRGNILPVLVMSGCGDSPGVVRSMKLGAVDFIEKPFSAEALLKAVAQALASFGTSQARRHVVHAATMRLNRLSPREREILHGLLDGLPNKGIAHRLGISTRTAEMHRAHMKAKLGFRTLSEILQFAIDAGMVPTGKGLPPHGPQPDRLIGTKSLVA